MTQKKPVHHQVIGHARALKSKVPAQAEHHAFGINEIVLLDDPGPHQKLNGVEQMQPLQG